MRILTDHEISNQAHAEEIQVLDQPGFGGACHEYKIISGDREQTIFFQDSTNEKYGLTDEALLTIIIDRLRSFQTGELRCSENGIALVYCERALNSLKEKNCDRLKRDNKRK